MFLKYFNYFLKFWELIEKWFYIISNFSKNLKILSLPHGRKSGYGLVTMLPIKPPSRILTHAMPMTINLISFDLVGQRH